jgi:hypothetical protein
MAKNDVVFNGYIETSRGPVYYGIMNSEAMQSELRRIAQRVESRVKSPQYRTSVEVRPGRKRAHAYVTGYLGNARSWREYGHNKKWGKILVSALQASLDRESE